jgi:hypothetical protein
MRHLRQRAALVAIILAAPARSQEASPDASDAQDLARALANPIASLVQVPIQQNFDFGWGPDGDGFRATTNVQPVIPTSVSVEWNLISRTILPIIGQDEVTGPGQSQSGLGDTVQSIFLSPKTTASGIIWGAGPVFLLPTATDRALGSGKWGIGPTAVVLKQSGKLTVGGLANHIWSFAGPSSRADLSATFVQPFVSYATQSATTFGISAEFSHEWRSGTTIMPVNATVAQLTRFGRQPVQLGAGFRWFVISPSGGPDWGLRLNLVFLFPR